MDDAIVFFNIYLTIRLIQTKLCNYISIFVGGTPGGPSVGPAETKNLGDGLGLEARPETSGEG